VQYYARLTQRLIAALAAPTAEGSAYQVDLRLRPSGNAGPLATSLAAFERYQLHEAWTWEHMAMSRGRVIAGKAALSKAVASVLDRIVTLPRERERLAADVADMRARLDRDKPAAGPLDVKLARGGLVDCEFAAQFLALSGVGRSFGETTGDILVRAGAAGRLPAAAAGAFVDGFRLQSTILHFLRIGGDAPADAEGLPEAMTRLLVGAAGQSGSFEAFLTELADAQQEVRHSLEGLLARQIAAAAPRQAC
jgi:glutamate-ammonia-ligase adenylyltransferase